MPNDLANLYMYRRRNNFSKNDLTKGVANSKPITDAQKEKIYDYWKPYLTSWKAKHAYDIRWFNIYNRTNIWGYALETYIPDGYYYGIMDMCLTNALDAHIMDDKNMYDLYFHDVNQPKTIAHKINGLYMDDNYIPITEDEVVDKCLCNGAVILKPSINTEAGRGISFWKKDCCRVEELIDTLKTGNSLVVQDLIKQHSSLSAFTDSCVNTMRIVTLIWNDEVIVTTAVLIMGGVSSKTNHLHAGGLVCGILPSGQLRDTAFDGQLNEYKSHPNGLKFADVKIPNYDKCVELVKRLAPRMAGVSKFLNWDITLDEFGNPLLIEVNLTWGGSVQIAGGPAFGDKTKDVLEYVKKTGTWKR